MLGDKAKFCLCFTALCDLVERQSTKPEWTHLHLKSLTEQVVVAETEQMRMAYHPKREGPWLSHTLVDLRGSLQNAKQD